MFSLKDFLFITCVFFTIFSRWGRVHNEREDFARNEMIDKEIRYDLNSRG